MAKWQNIFLLIFSGKWQIIQLLNFPIINDKLILLQLNEEDNVSLSINLINEQKWYISTVDIRKSEHIRYRLSRKWFKILFMYTHKGHNCSTSIIRHRYRIIDISTVRFLPWMTYDETVEFSYGIELRIFSVAHVQGIRSNRMIRRVAGICSRFWHVYTSVWQSVEKWVWIITVRQSQHTHLQIRTLAQFHNEQQFPTSFVHSSWLLSCLATDKGVNVDVNSATEIHHLRVFVVVPSDVSYSNVIVYVVKVRYIRMPICVRAYEW